MRKYFDFIVGLIGYMRRRCSTEDAIVQAKDSIAARINNRDANFLHLLEHGVFSNPASPYLKLLSAKKIVHADIRQWVGSDGIEHALGHLHSEGVYFSVDEFKGTAEVARNGVTFSVAGSDFDNPLARSAYVVRSGGTRSSGTAIPINVPLGDG